MASENQSDISSPNRGTPERRERSAIESEQDGMEKRVIKRLKQENKKLMKGMKGLQDSFEELEKENKLLKSERQKTLLELGEQDFEKRAEINRLKNALRFKEIFPTSQATTKQYHGSNDKSTISR